MPPRSLRVGTRLPNPGAVLRGCPRPKALRFDSPLSGRRSAFGDGTYSGNILQNGVPLQPQNYLLDGIIPLPRCIVITGAATVAPDETTDAAVWMAHNVVAIGASASLAASVNCKGLFGFVSGTVAMRGGAHMHMDALGKAGAFGDLSPDMLLPALLARHVASDKLKTYVVKGRGAEGGARTPNSSYANNPGHAAGPMQTGGGGTGMTYDGIAGAGGCGGPCCGGAGSGGAVHNVASGDAGQFGGPGSAGITTSGGAGGGAGDPPGHAGPISGDEPGRGAGGGLLCLVASTLALDASTLISADGAQGGDSSDCPGGSSGGGCIVIITRPGGYANNGTVRALGGATTRAYSGPGGSGSVNIFELEE